jgi:hypothetical protein
VTDLDFTLHLGGRKPQPLGAEVLRELTSSDLGLLTTERGVKPTHLQRITDRHHALARCLATGMGAAEASLVTGYTPSRISVLRGDPAFEELIAFYTGAKGEAVRDYQEKAAIARNMATDILIERMEDNPETIDAGLALDVAKNFADRTGHGPKATNVNVNVNLGDRMKAARERASSIPREGPRPAGHEATLAPTIIEGDFKEIK